MSYQDFLARKAAPPAEVGIPIKPGSASPTLHKWQAEIVEWAVRTGRAAIWADTGLGKTRMQIEWARMSGPRALVIAPLAVCVQTSREASSIGVAAVYVRDPSEIVPGVISITNYEMASRFDPSLFDCVVLDEASILKNCDGKMRTMLIRHFASVPRRLACTATPAPNEPTELTSQAEFLGRSTRAEMLAAYFIHDQDGWRLKGHGRDPMFRWMSSWAVALRRPSDIGYPDEGYSLPPLNIIPHTVQTGLDMELGGIVGRSQVRKATIGARVDYAIGLIKQLPDEPWLIWAGLNAEADAITDAIPGAVNVHGAHSPEFKAKALNDFGVGGVKVLVTKSSIAGFGMNFQRCANMVFVGLGDSYEQYYQCVRRCWRYGQTRPVNAHVVLSDLEGAIAENVARKEDEASAMVASLIAAMNTTRRSASL